MKQFNTNKKTNIVITGGLSGLGRLLAERFAQNYHQGEINLIVISRSEINLSSLKESLLKQSNGKFKDLSFYKCDVSNTK